jgi:hypothetical protein
MKKIKPTKPGARKRAVDPVKPVKPAAKKTAKKTRKNPYVSHREITAPIMWLRIEDDAESVKIHITMDLHFDPKQASKYLKDLAEQLLK